MFELPPIWERSERWLRVIFDEITIADSQQAMLMIENDREMDYYFPLSAIRQGLLVSSDYVEQLPVRGTRRFWHIVSANRHAENAAWTYDPQPNRPDFSGFVAFKWSAMDHWFEEKEEVFLEPRNPYHRVDFIPSTRHIRVTVDEQTIAETKNPLLVFETNTPIRFYFAPTDVELRYLKPSTLHTRCQYKGLASYYTIEVDGAIYENAAWYYPEPLPESWRVQGKIAFFPERNPRIQVWVNSKLYMNPRRRRKKI